MYTTSKNNTNYSKNLYLSSNKTKQEIIRYLNSTGINLHTKFEIISSESDLNYIRDNEYIICPKYSGVRSWVIFFKNDNDVYYAVSFPKYGRLKKEEFSIFPIDVSVTKQLYYGTIMEGIYFKMDNKKCLIIDEVYQFAGEHMLLKTKRDRLEFLQEKFKTTVVMTPNYGLYVSAYFSPDKENIKELYNNIKNNMSIQEIIFYPNIYGKKVYSYMITETDLVDNIIKLAQLYLEKTASPDVYNLYRINSDKKIDIAYIPDIETSRKCKQWFKDSKEKNY